jgi:hypothetical protein
MTPNKTSPLFRVGDRVKIRHWDWRARIVEFRGPLGPGGMLVYRVRIPNKPKPRYIELCEDQLIAIPTTTNADSRSSARRGTRGKPRGSGDQSTMDKVE